MCTIISLLYTMVPIRRNVTTMSRDFIIFGSLKIEKMTTLRTNKLIVKNDDIFLHVCQQLFIIMHSFTKWQIFKAP